MPNGSGFYAIKKIQEFDAKAKIIAVSADGSPPTEEKLDKLNIPSLQLNSKQLTWHSRFIFHMPNHKTQNHASKNLLYSSTLSPASTHCASNLLERSFSPSTRFSAEYAISTIRLFPAPLSLFHLSRPRLLTCKIPFLLSSDFVMCGTAFFLILIARTALLVSQHSKLF